MPRPFFMTRKWRQTRAAELAAFAGARSAGTHASRQAPREMGPLVVQRLRRPPSRSRARCADDQEVGARHTGGATPPPRRRGRPTRCRPPRPTRRHGHTGETEPARTSSFFPLNSLFSHSQVGELHHTPARGANKILSRTVHILAHYLKKRIRMSLSVVSA